MRPDRPPRRAAVTAAALTALATLATTLTGAATAVAAPAAPVLVVDDFEYASGLPVGADANGVALGYSTFAGAGSSIALANPGTGPAPANTDRPAQGKVLELDLDVTSYAGVIHSFENAAMDTWVSQDWSTYAGFTMWLYGQGTGTTLFVDLLENRNPGSVKDDAQRWSANVADDFTGWKQLEIPFTSFTEKVVGNGAPRDDLERTEMHGWAIGALGTGGPRTYYVDDAGVYGIAPLAPLAASFTTAGYRVTEGTTGDIGVRLSRPLRAGDPAQVSVDYAVSAGTALVGRDVAPTSGTLTFVNGGPRALTFPLATIGDTKYQGDRNAVLRLSNPVGMVPGSRAQAYATISDDDPYDALLLDDFETTPDLWRTSTGVQIDNPTIDAGSADALPGQGASEHVLQVSAPESGATYQARIQGIVTDLRALRASSGPAVTRSIDKAIGELRAGLDRDYWIDGFALDHHHGTTVFAQLRNAVSDLGVIVRARKPQSAAAQSAIDGIVAVTTTLATNAIDDAVRNGADAKRIRAARADLAKAQQSLAAGRADRAVDDHRKAWATATSATDTLTRSGTAPTPPSVGRDFAIGQDWSNASALSFWYQGQNTGNTIGVQLLDNRAPDPGPSGWDLAWSDEFSTPAGTAPDPATWGFEIGDGTGNGNPGWGNDELQYYTDSTDNAATDGQGNMVITAKPADGSLQCYYGPCTYTSARLLSADKAEFAYGRIESRIQVPSGKDGLWPAFWSLGTDIDRVGWPQTGEIDVMEYVSRIPDEVFGTIHGPGYSGGASFGGIQHLPAVAASYHTYAIEWAPDVIHWYVDGVLYHSATPTDVAPNEWVFNDPVFLLLNMAIGGNFGGAVSPDLTFPQQMKIDYVRSYRAPDTAERFEAPLLDDFTGWKQVTIPFSDFTRSARQPAGAPNDGLGLDDVWGYGFQLPPAATTSSPEPKQPPWYRPSRPSPHGPCAPRSAPQGPLMIDQVRLVDTTAPTVTISDAVGEATATGDVPFTFAFSEDVGASFTEDDVTLTGGTKGAFTRVDATHATLVARPPADATGTLEVSVAVGAFTDLAGNPNTSASVAQQAYVTPPPPSGGFVVSFDEATAPVLTGFGGAEDSSVVADPSGASTKVARVLKAAGSQVWAGTTISTQPGLTVPAIGFTPTATTMTARIWSPAAGVPVRLKVENATDGSQSVETEATTTLAGAWEALTFDFANQAAGTTALNLAATYDKVSVFFDFGTAGTGATYYLDDLSWP